MIPVQYDAEPERRRRNDEQVRQLEAVLIADKLERNARCLRLLEAAIRQQEYDRAAAGGARDA